MFNANAIFVSVVSRCSLAVLMASPLALGWEISRERSSQWLSKLWEEFAKGGRCAQLLLRSYARSHRIQDPCCGRERECRASSSPIQNRHDAPQFLRARNLPG